MSLDSKENFRLVYKLATKQRWLEDKDEQLFALLFSECEDEESRKLVVELIERFKHVTDEEYSDLISALAKNISSIADISDATTQVVAMAADSSTDSSQRILYDLKLPFEKLKWRKYKHVNQFGRAYRTFRDSPQHINIVLVDEFVGSGQSAISRVEAIQRQFDGAGVAGYKICIRVLVGMSEGIDNVRKKGIDIESLVCLKKGITDLSPQDRVGAELDLMRGLEAKLLPVFEDTEMPSLGYGQTESLYTRDGGNTPNSVFPIFWWPFFLDGSEREILLHRAMGDA